MFDDSGFGGNSMFDMNHDGRLNGFEADARDCFLHDKDTFDQVKISGSGKRRSYGKAPEDSLMEIGLWIIGVTVITVVLTLMGL